uniref:Uncharacterized protein n=1 Tax=Capra hircus TaxID=9925 RepID=A0A8C2PCN7_CAPHI
MATEAPVTIAPAECSPVGSTATDSFLWQPDSLNMHVTRPKSAKGRTRPRLYKHLGTEGCSGRAPASLPPAIPCESPSSQKPGACTPRSPDQGAPSEIPELLQQAPFGASSSLNKYPVLPSINRRTLEEGALETVAKKAGSLQLSSHQMKSQGCCSPSAHPQAEGSSATSGQLMTCRPSWPWPNTRTRPPTNTVPLRRWRCPGDVSLTSASLCRTVESPTSRCWASPRKRGKVGPESAAIGLGSWVSQRGACMGATASPAACFQVPYRPAAPVALGMPTLQASSSQP